MKAGWESLVKEAAKIIYKHHATIKNADQVNYFFSAMAILKIVRECYKCSPGLFGRLIIQESQRSEKIHLLHSSQIK